MPGSGLQQTYPLTPPRADLQKEDFEQLIYQKGRRVLYERALQCPCKSIDINQQSNCRNCGGTGWLYINPTELRMVITGVGIVNEYKSWSEESRGMINITCPNSVKLCFMDRLTLLDGEGVYQETLQFLKTRSNEYIAYSKYPIKKILYSGKFISVNSPLQRLTSFNFSLQRNLVKLDPQVVQVGEGESKDTAISITVRYLHSPIYHVIELKRESMESFKYIEGNEVQQRMPLSALGRRLHYLQNAPMLLTERLIDNSFEDSNNCCLDSECCDDDESNFEQTTTTTIIIN